MASVGVEFDRTSLDRVIQQSDEFYLKSGANPVAHGAKRDRRRIEQWAAEPIYENNRPVRPWALGEMQKDSSVLFRLSGESTRTPGTYQQVDPKTRLDKGKFLENTNEGVHSSVRVRLACEGLGLNDRCVWRCEALADWRLRRVTVVREVRYESGGRAYCREEAEERWLWKYVGDDSRAPDDADQRTMWEAPLGYYERYLLDRCGGTPNVYDYAERRASRSRSRSRRGRGKPPSRPPRARVAQGAGRAL